MKINTLFFLLGVLLAYPAFSQTAQKAKNQSKAANDAAIEKILYSPKVVRNRTPEAISAIVSNQGENALNNLSVRLIVNGANSALQINSIATLPVGETDTVHFSEILFTDLGMNTVSVSVAADDNTSNDEIIVNQEVSAYEMAYHEPDSTIAENQGYGTGKGILASRFSISGTDSVKAVRVVVGNDPQNAGQNVYAVLLKAQNNDTLVVANSAPYTLTENDLGKARIFNFPAAVIVSDEDFWAGIAQTQGETPAEYYPLGTSNTDWRRNDFFRAETDGSNLQHDNSPGIFMLEALLINSRAQIEAMYLDNQLGEVDIVSGATANYITAEVTAGSSVNSLQPEFELAYGANITPTDAQNFSNSTATPVQYTVTAQDNFNQIVWDVSISVGEQNLEMGALPATEFFVSAIEAAQFDIPFTLTGTFDVSNKVQAYLGTQANWRDDAGLLIGQSAATAGSGSVEAQIAAASFVEQKPYRIRLHATCPKINTADNGENLTITVVSDSIAPSSPQTISAGSNGTTLSATVYPQNLAASSFQWAFATSPEGEYTDIQGATQSSYTPNFDSEGTYFIACFAEIQGVKARSNQVEIQVEASSEIGEISNGKIKIYPNPAQNKIWVENAPQATLEIFSSAGVLLKKIENPHHKAGIDISELPAGLYILKISAEKSQSTHQFSILR